MDKRMLTPTIDMGCFLLARSYVGWTKTGIVLGMD